MRFITTALVLTAIMRLKTSLMTIQIISRLILLQDELYQAKLDIYKRTSLVKSNHVVVVFFTILKRITTPSQAKTVKKRLMKGLKKNFKRRLRKNLKRSLKKIKMIQAR